MLISALLAWAPSFCAAHDVAAEAARAFCTLCASDASAVVAFVKMLVRPVASATAVLLLLLEAPLEELLVLVPSPPAPEAAAPLLALPELKVVLTMRAGMAEAVALLVDGPPVMLVLLLEVLTLRGAAGLMLVSCADSGFEA